ncbi:MAG: asparagine synthase (glutamine-hydrolyzing) [Methanothrix sp.]|uniref:asparagine synthase (glutamine-hydrolyzing) n=1 Tax=Methanothrix sp. TaxID=90426 RepID=UPI0032B01E16|nr:asparagine synthase (glutamine-hydrolyzing) [Methanothrix sp.]
MCGICGFTWNDQELISKMNHAIKHRGPDDAGTYIDELVSLGHCRLSIIDLSSAGHQPMPNEDESMWIVYNGEIYNFVELRSILVSAGHKFRSKTDTEVVLHSYEEWGPYCVEKFNGMWAFAIYNKAKKELFLSRDRFGVKPLYYHISDKGLIFCSEIKGILEHDFKVHPEDSVIYDYLAFGLMDHRRETFFSGIHRLMPGENMIYDLQRKDMKLISWYNLKDRLNKIPRTDFYDEETVKAKVRSLLEDSVRYRLIADVPVGSCLSGGIDSSAIVYIMKKSKINQLINTFSMVFPNHRMDESHYIREVVKDTKVNAFTVTPTTEDLIADLQDLIRTQEEPFRSLSIYGQYRVMKLANETGMKVLLDGQGADELFAGYRIYMKYYIFDSLIHMQLREAAKALQSAEETPLELMLFFSATIALKLGLTSVFHYLWNKRLKYLKPFYKGSSVNIIKERGFSLNHALWSDLIKYSLPQLLRYEDKNSMRWSIESRVPFLDYRLVEFVSGLPANLKIRNGITKYILRRALKGLVSEMILSRKDKIGFATPDDNWLENKQFRDMVLSIIKSDKFRSRPYWRSEVIEKMIEDKHNVQKNWSELIWRVINLELWLRAYDLQPQTV